VNGKCNRLFKLLKCLFEHLFMLNISVVPGAVEPEPHRVNAPTLRKCYGSGSANTDELSQIFLVLIYHLKFHEEGCNLVGEKTHNFDSVSLCKHFGQIFS
jgi:hypothetical protein